LLIKGIQNGLEKANKVLIPSLFGLLVIITVIALNMENGTKGLEYMFGINWNHFSNPTIWIEALSQSAWSTGAGWGLIMTISSYSRKREDVVLNTFISGFGNNTASIMAGMAILPAVFALAVNESEAISFLQSGNQALTFTIIPKLFSTVNGGAILSFIFFLAFFMAAFSSLLPMLELFISNLKDIGMTRKSAAIKAGIFCIVFGFPSAWSLDIFNNQDWVWGIGLIISGLLIIIAALRYGIKNFKKDFIDTDSDISVPIAYLSITLVFNVFLAAVLIYWWMSRGYSEYPWFDANGNWNVFDVYSNASVVTQWLLVIGIGVILNKYLYKKFVKS
ncbi:MAG: sodium-dependent transporter, partial [Fulvivirga sp.]|uniref:sodium-dependent transporter n=1 Tax=Fulvivirga sp. TaxID=1931237 RepID=UPI0032ECD691